MAMMRTTLKHLELKVQYLNKITGNPETYCDKSGTPPFKAKIGHYHIGQQYGGVSLDQVATECGAIHTIFPTTTKSDLFRLINAYINGVGHNIIIREAKYKEVE